MTSSKLDLILHPVRMRIITILSSEAGLTASQLAAALPDVAQATLYRHINALAQGEILSVVEENPVRGTVEKVYALASPDAAIIRREEAVPLSADEHLRYFTAFMAAQLGNLERYIHRADADPINDGFGYHTILLHVTDEELMSLVSDMNALLAPYLHDGDVAGRRKRLFSTILMPAPDTVPHDTEDREGN